LDKTWSVTHAPALVPEARMILAKPVVVVTAVEPEPFVPIRMLGIGLPLRSETLTHKISD
jgi:hypothetical protein